MMASPPDCGNPAKNLPCGGKHYAIVPSESAHLLPIFPISCPHIFPDRPLSQASRTSVDSHGAALANNLCACGMAGDSAGAPSPAICMIHQRTTTINDDGGGDDGDDDDGGGPALGWPLPERQRPRIRGSFFAVVSWGSHLLNSDVSRMEIGVSEGARRRAIQISGKSRFQAQTAPSSNANRENYFCRRSYSTDDKFGISPSSLGWERRMRKESGLAKCGAGSKTLRLRPPCGYRSATAQRALPRCALRFAAAKDLVLGVVLVPAPARARARSVRFSRTELDGEAQVPTSREREAISPLSFPPPAPLPKGSELSLGKTGREPLNLRSRE